MEKVGQGTWKQWSLRPREMLSQGHGDNGSWDLEKSSHRDLETMVTKTWRQVVVETRESGQWNLETNGYRGENWSREPSDLI